MYGYVMFSLTHDIIPSQKSDVFSKMQALPQITCMRIDAFDFCIKRIDTSRYWIVTVQGRLTMDESQLSVVSMVTEVCLPCGPSDYQGDSINE